MKLAKKLIALALVLCMVFCLSIAAFAVNQKADGTYEDEPSITITKEYKKVGTDSVSPAETFYLVQEGQVAITKSEATYDAKYDLTTTTTDGVTYVAKVDYAAGEAGSETATKNFTINLPEYDHVGVYTYKLKEIKGNTLGVTYYEQLITLVVTVINDKDGNCRIAQVHTEIPQETDSEKKSDRFDNTYSAGTLTVTKEVIGNMGDKDKKFTFKITFKTPDEDTEMKSTLTASVAGTDVDASKIEYGTEYTFELSDGDSAIFKNIPWGTKYTVSEVEDSNYTTYIGVKSEETKASSSGEKEMDSLDEAFKFINEREGEIDTGITLDSLPYLLALAFAFGGAVVLFTRKRRVED